uniref:Uncharacterized protein n=1 Tax=Anguilla anguilla TaxID=7936 RepID=A0A0E9RXJ4_ANGAN
MHTHIQRTGKPQGRELHMAVHPCDNFGIQV